MIDVPGPRPPQSAHALIEGMLDAVWIVDAERLCVAAANSAAGTLTGTAPGELVGRHVLELAASPEDLVFWSEAQTGTEEGIESMSLVRHADGRAIPVLRRVTRLPEGEGGWFVVALDDRSERQRIEAELDDRLAELAATLESTADGILVTDLAGNIRSFNRRFAALWALPSALLQQRQDDDVLTWMRRSVDDPAGYMRRLCAIEDEAMREASDTLTLRSGKVLERVTMPQCSRGQAIGRVFSFRDITEQVEARRQIDTLSHTDPLTGLPNRAVLVDRAGFALALAQRDGTPFGLLFVNLDRFNHINETLGHVVADSVLVDVAGRLKSCVRQVDTVARIGGDEFVLLVHEADARGAEVAARRLLDAMQRPFAQGGLSFTLTCSVGIALHPHDGDTLDELLRQADSAMHEVKKAGRGTFAFHRPDHGEGQDPRSRLRLDHAMRLALTAGRFRLHYQPQVAMGSGEVRGAEALIRWTDPELGEVSPAEFIAAAEETGFIVAIGDWVLREAVTQAARWQDEGIDVVVAVNVSALQFQQVGFVEGVATALRVAGLEPTRLELELTESILIHRAEDALLRLQALAALGVQLSIDDFGTGYSSLGYLKRFPISRLKIDRSFVSGLPEDASDASIVHAIVHLGRALKLTVIAEGVETEAQRRFLEETGCHAYQGFLCAPALPAEAFARRFLAPQPRLPAVRLATG